MVHLVVDEGVDDGPVLATCHVEFTPGDTVVSFGARMHAHEHALLVETLRRVCADGPQGMGLTPNPGTGLTPQPPSLRGGARVALPGLRRQRFGRVGERDGATMAAP